MAFFLPVSPRQEHGPSPRPMTTMKSPCRSPSRSRLRENRPKKNSKKTTCAPKGMLTSPPLVQRPASQNRKPPRKLCVFYNPFGGAPVNATFTRISKLNLFEESGVSNSGAIMQFAFGGLPENSRTETAAGQSRRRSHRRRPREPEKRRTEG